jgi:probable F420-dependent oxidoreductase
MTAPPARPFRFGVNLLGVGDRAQWLAKCVTAEQLGYDVILVPDHLGMPAPFPALVAAAGVTERPRLGTFVLNAAFYNPTLLARDVAATDQLTGGRLELGLGTGYARDEFDTAGLRFGSGGERVDHLTATVKRLRDLLADPEHQPAPAQHPVPFLLGGNGNRMLRLAARTADIVGFIGASSDSAGRLSLVSPATLAQRVEFTRAAAGDRAGGLELNVLVQTVEVTEKKDAATAQRLHQLAPNLTLEEFEALPTVLFGTAEQIAEKLRVHRKRYITVLEGAMEPFAKVIELLRGS